MKIKVYIEKEQKTKQLDVKSIKQILKKLKINPETVIITRNNKIVTEDTKLNKNETIKLLSVISGG